jgi:hypothetical protein
MRWRPDVDITANFIAMKISLWALVVAEYVDVNSLASVNIDIGLCAILLWLYTSTEHLTRMYTSPQLIFELTSLKENMY